MKRTDAPGLLNALFDDEGRSILAEGGKGSWEEALSKLPEGMFAVNGGKLDGRTLLTLARDLWSRAGDLRMATAATRGLMRYYVEQHGVEHPDALVELGALGALAQKAGRVAEGADLLEQAWVGLRSVVGGRDLRLAVVAGNLGVHYARETRLEEAVHLLDVAHKIRKRVAPETLANVAGQLGEIRLRLGDVDAGLDNLREAWLTTLDAQGEQHPQTVQRALRLARALNQTKNFRESAPIWRDLHTLAIAAGDAVHKAEIGFSLSKALYRTHKKEEAIRLLDQALRFARSQEARTGTPPKSLPDWLSFRGQIELDERRPSSAEGLFAEAVEVERRLTGPDSAETARRYVTLGVLIGKLGRLDEGMGTIDQAASVLLSRLGPKHAWTQAAMASMVDLLAEKIEQVVGSDKSTAQLLVAHAIQTGGGVLGFDHASVRRVQGLASRYHLA